MTPLLLRYAVLALAAVVSGAVLVNGTRYTVATWRNDRKAPGRVLFRHVAEVSFGTLFLVLGFAWAMVVQLDGRAADGADARLWMYLIGMSLLAVGLFDLRLYQDRVRRAAERVRAERLAEHGGGAPEGAELPGGPS